jgi:hypothetical protein
MRLEPGGVEETYDYRAHVEAITRARARAAVEAMDVEQR